MLLLSKCYSTHDSDLLISLGILPDCIHCFGRKTSLSTKCIAELIIENELLGRAVCRCGRWCIHIVTISLTAILSGSVTVILMVSPCIMTTECVISVHSIVFSATAVAITLGRDNGRISLSKMTVRDSRKLASNLAIITMLGTHWTIPGWARKGKGLLQVLWEWGWIDVSKITQYKKVVTNDTRYLVKELLLEYMLETCTNFAYDKLSLSLFVRVSVQRGS